MNEDHSSVSTDGKCKVDNETLTKCITRCFNNSMDGQFSQEQRSQYRARGKQLRGCLVNSLSAIFKEGDEGLLQANKKIEEVNKTLKEETQRLENIADTIEQLGQLVSILNNLLNSAIRFV